MSQYLPANNPLGRIDFKKDQRTIRPLPPVGNLLDGTAHEKVSALFAASQQVTVDTLGGSTATGDVTTVTITPTKTAHGSPWADEIPALVIEVTTGATETLTALGELIEARAAAIAAISSNSDTDDWQPIKDFCTVTAAAGVITITTRDAGARFDYSFVTDGSATSSTSSTGTTDDELRVGTVAILDSYTNGHPKIVEATSSSTAANIWGVVAEGNGCASSDSAYSFKVYPAGSDVPVIRWGKCTAYCEGAATVGGDVYVRKTATGTEIEGALAAVASVTTDTAEVYTLTPTAANSTLYAARIDVLNFWTGAVVTSGRIYMTSDADGTATEICDGLRTSLADDNDQLDSYVTGGGTTTLTLTAAGGYKLAIYPDSPGILAGYDTPSTAGASDHLLWSGAKFLETTTAAGIQAISIPHP